MSEVSPSLVSFVLDSFEIGGRRRSAISDRNLASSSFWPLVQPFSELPQHETEDRSGRAANRRQCGKSPLTRASEMGDLVPFLSGDHEGVSSYL